MLLQMTELELTDRILAICDENSKHVHIKAHLKQYDLVDTNTSDFKTIFSGSIKILKSHDLIEEKESTIGGDRFLTTSPKGHILMNEYGSYSGWRKSESEASVEQKKENKSTVRRANISLIIGAVGAIVGLFGFWTNYQKGETIDLLQEQIETLMSENESISQELEEQKMLGTSNSEETKENNQ